MFEALGFVVDLPPFHTEHFGQHPFDEVVTEDKFAGDLTSGGGEADFARSADAHQAIFFKATQRHRNGRWRDFQQMCESGGDHRFTLGFGFEDGLEVILLGDGDHGGIIPRGS